MGEAKNRAAQEKKKKEKLFRETLMRKLEWKSCSRFNARPKRCFNISSTLFPHCFFDFTQPRKRELAKFARSGWKEGEENVIVPLTQEKNARRNVKEICLDVRLIMVWI